MEIPLCETQQQDPVFRQMLLWKKYKNRPITPTLTTRANKCLFHYYRRFQDLCIDESNQLLYYTQELKSPIIGLSFSFLLIAFHKAQILDISGHPSREKFHASISDNNYFPKFRL